MPKSNIESRVVDFFENAPIEAASTLHKVCTAIIKRRAGTKSSLTRKKANKPAPAAEGEGLG